MRTDDWYRRLDDQTSAESHAYRDDINVEKLRKEKGLDGL